MPRALDLADIQGNVLRSYGLPKARYICLHIAHAAAGRAFIQAIRGKVTTALPWQSKERYPRPHPSAPLPPKPLATVNLAFTFRGLLALELPTTTLSGLPAEFIDGMAARAHILGDDAGPAAEQRWDAVWFPKDSGRMVHVLVTICAQMNPDGTAVAELDQLTQWLFDACTASNGVSVLPGHGPANAPYQDASVLLSLLQDGTYAPSPKVHFGFTDGFGDPVFEGQYADEAEAEEAIGGGKILPNQQWAPLATGEFLLGYPDEAQETPPASRPFEFTRNGTFLAYRKLHQNVATFQDYIVQTAAAYARVNRVADVEQAREIILAKLAGRWPDGVPLSVAPSYDAWQAFRARESAARTRGDAAALAAIERSYVDFMYRTDPAGLKCPLGSHMRRANTRDMLDPGAHSTNPKDWNGSVLNNRRRILRRGVPYGTVDPAAPSDAGEQGMIFLALCSSLFRQFEFVQQQWIQYGLDFNAGNDTCPLLGNHGPEAKFVIPGNTQDGTQPFVCTHVPQFVEARGGDYFFVPSMTALRLMGMGLTDPT
jgi:deferrochelatase/peroxidase EfeB